MFRRLTDLVAGLTGRRPHNAPTPPAAASATPTRTTWVWRRVACEFCRAEVGFPVVVTRDTTGRVVDADPWWGWIAVLEHMLGDPDRHTAPITDVVAGRVGWSPW